MAVSGIDCTECARHVTEAISELEGVRSVEVFVQSGKVAISFDPHLTELSRIERAIKNAGYTVSEHSPGEKSVC